MLPRLILASVIAFSLAFISARASADEITLLFATGNGADTHPDTLVMHPWAQSITNDGKGIVRDGGVIANAENAYDRTLADVIQIGWTLENDVPGKFVRSDVATLPFMARSSAEGSIALWRMYRSGVLDSEYDTIHPLVLAAMTAAGIHLSQALKSLDSLGSAKMIVAAKVNADAITLLGGSPLSIPLFDMYQAIQRCTADAALHISSCSHEDPADRGAERRIDDVQETARGCVGRPYAGRAKNPRGVPCRVGEASGRKHVNATGACMSGCAFPLSRGIATLTSAALK